MLEYVFFFISPIESKEGATLNRTTYFANRLPFISLSEYSVYNLYDLYISITQTVFLRTSPLKSFGVLITMQVTRPHPSPL